MTRPEPRTLAAALRLAADDLQAQQPPPALQSQVVAAVRAAGAPAARPQPARPAWWWGGAVAATLLLGCAWLVLPGAPPLVDDGLRLGTFMRVAPPERWPAAPAAAWLVRTELQAERLAALGLPYDPARAAEPVRTELLVHPSGEVLALRFVP